MKGNGASRGRGRAGGPARCEGCRLPGAACVCERLPRVRPGTRIIVVQHASEGASSSNTGCLVRAVLEGTRVLVHGAPEQALDRSALEATGGPARLLFPVPGAPVVGPEAFGPEAVDPEAARVLVVLDATWSKARRMYRRLDVLRGLAPVTLPSGVRPSWALRRPRAPGQVGTAEAVAHALALLGDGRAAGALRAALELVAPRVLGSRGRRGGRGRPRAGAGAARDRDRGAACPP